MARDLTIATAGGLASAALYLATLTDAPVALMLAYLALLPLCAVGLGWGISASAIAALIAAVVVAVIASVTVGVTFALAYSAPAVVAVWLLLRSRAASDGKTTWYPLGALVVWLALYACGAFALMALIAGDSGVREAVAAIEKILTPLMQVGQSPEVAVLIRAISQHFAAIVICSWMVMVLVNLALAQGVLQRFKRNLRPWPPAAAIALPGWYTLVTVGAAALALAARLLDLETVGFIARNVALGLLVPFFLVGLAVVHVWARQWPAKMVILAGFYLLLLVSGWVSLVAVSGLGFMEQWLRLRRRFAGPGSQEDEQ